MKKRITMTMIAEACNTSIGTVDRAINNRPGINSETKAQILKTAAHMGYRVNSLTGHSTRRKRYRIGIISCKRHSDFHDYILEGIEQAKKELTDFGFHIDTLLTDFLSQTEQQELLSSIQAKDYDGFAINAAGSSTDEFINCFMDLGIPVITFNTDAPTSKRLFYVGTDAKSAGNLAGELIGKLTNGHGKAAALGSFLQTNAFIERYVGFYQVIQTEYHGIKLCPWAECNNDPASAETETKRIIQEYPDLRALYVTGSSITTGAIHALKELDRKDIILIGHDLSKTTSAAIDENWCTATLYQNPYQQGYQAARLLARHILEGWLPSDPRLIIPSQIIMKYNKERKTYGTRNSMVEF